MRQHRYQYVRPNELSIPLSTGAKERIGITTAAELQAAENAANKQRYLEAIDLLEGILLDEPNNKQSKRILADIRKKCSDPGRVHRLMKQVASTRFSRMLPPSVKRPIKKLVLRFE
jgi:hypothetical protein